MKEIDLSHLPKSPPQPGAEPQAQKVIKQKIFQGIPSPKARSETRPESRRSSITSPLKSPSEPLSKPLQESRPRPRPSINSTTTGYQGTARPPPPRKPSINTNTNTPKSLPNKPPTPTAKGSPSTTSSSSVAAPPRSSSLLKKFLGKKATRTRTEAQPIPNVFTGGKRRQQRRSLRDAMVDPSKNPKQFANMHIQNLARKKGIEMNDGAPLDISSIPAAFIIGNDQAKPKTQQESQTEVHAATIVESPTSLTPTLTAHSGVSANSSDISEPVPSRKPRKSVRFSDADDLPVVSGNSDHMLDKLVDLEDPLVEPETSAVHTAGKKKLSLTNYQGRPQTHTVSKKCSFGQNGSTEIRARFLTVPRQNQQSLSTFLQEEKLNFHLVCSSYDFMHQRLYLCEEVLSSGVLDAEGEEPAAAAALENVAEHMRRRSSGLYLAKPEYSILVYPTRCDTWEGIAGDQIQQSSTESTLRYLIFKAPIDIKQYPTNTDIPAEATSGEYKTTIEILVRVMMDLDFSTMTTHNSRDQDNQVFMLMFPPEDTRLLRVITLWLRKFIPP